MTKRRRSNSWITHAIADCHDCDWTDCDYQTARKKGYEHYRKTGHVVCVEVGRVYYYGEEK